MQSIDSFSLRSISYTLLAAAVSMLPASDAAALSLTLGDLVITEFMSNPDGVSDAQGEWFELHNAGTTAIELDGLSVRDTSTAVGTLDFGGSFLLAPGGYASVARSVNAGFVPDGLYDSISLNNGGDAIHIDNGTTPLATLIYGSGEGSAGASTAIDLAAPGLGTPVWFADTENLYGLGNSGTPGLANLLGAATGTVVTILPSASPVPLPAALWLLVSGFGLLAVRWRDCPLRGRGFNR